VLFTPLALGSTLGFMHFMELPLLDMLQLWLFLMGVVYLVFHRRDPRFAILMLWFFVPSVFLLVSKLDLYPHYFICFYPIQFVAVGIVAHAMMENLRQRHKALRYVIPALIVVLVSYQASSSVKFIASIATRGQMAWAAYGAHYGPPYRYRVQEIGELSQKGIIAPEAMQKAILEEQPPGARVNFDFPATKYIVENLSALR
jgi:hypothetical protein